MDFFMRKYLQCYKCSSIQFLLVILYYYIHQEKYKIENIHDIYQKIVYSKDFLCLFGKVFVHRPHFF